MSRTCEIPLREIELRFGPSGGPGGQHANRAHTRVDLRFDVAGSPSLGPRQRARLLERLGPEVRLSVDDERSQARNRSIALDRLRERLAEGLRQERPRTPTKPSRAARAERVESKRRRGEVKRRRARPRLDEG